MSINVATRTLALRLNRLIKAPRERVFAAWTKPDELTKWFGPETCRILSARTDLRTGGQYYFHVKSQDIGEHDIRGIYREVKAPSRLAFTWNVSGSPEMEFGESLVSINFVDKEGFTEIQLTHEGLPNPDVRQKHEQGWTGCFDKLEKYIAAECAEKMTPGKFCWNELLTSDVAGATTFYSKLFGWKTEEFPNEGMKYLMLKKDGTNVGGLMKVPDANVPTHWLAYVAVENTDATVKKTQDLGGKVCKPAFDIPSVGRIAVLQDPQGATFAIIQPEKS
jgi:predicted enzyme related to lactoylglutathione lyase/uncharacterized protein YndB with AHSA1/START domain